MGRKSFYEEVVGAGIPQTWPLYAIIIALTLFVILPTVVPQDWRASTATKAPPSPTYAPNLGAWQPQPFYSGPSTFSKNTLHELHITVGASGSGGIPCPVISFSPMGPKLNKLDVFQGGNFVGGLVARNIVTLPDLSPGEARVYTLAMDTGSIPGSFHLIVDDYCGEPLKGNPAMVAEFSIT